MDSTFIGPRFNEAYGPWKDVGLKTGRKYSMGEAISLVVDAADVNVTQDSTYTLELLPVPKSIKAEKVNSGKKINFPLNGIGDYKLTLTSRSVFFSTTEDLQRFTLQCAPTYELIGTGCQQRIACQEYERWIRGKCVPLQAQATIRETTVSRIMYKPSNGLELQGNYSVPPAIIEIKATDEILAFSWHAALKIQDPQNVAPACVTPNVTLQLNPTKGTVDRTSAIETVKLAFDPKGLCGWNESDVINYNMHAARVLRAAC